MLMCFLVFFLFTPLWGMRYSLQRGKLVSRLLVKNNSYATKPTDFTLVDTEKCHYPNDTIQQKYMKAMVAFHFKLNLADYKCSICKKDDDAQAVDTGWLDGWVHKSCNDTLDPICSDADQRILDYFGKTKNYKEFREQNKLRELLIARVQRQCGKQTILDYLNVHGSTALKKVFDDYVGEILEHRNTCDKLIKAHKELETLKSKS